MTRATLPTHIASLVHHIELSKAGWRDKAFDRLILGIVWLEGERLTSQGVLDALGSNCQFELDASTILGRIGYLCKQGSLLLLPDSRLKISEQERVQIELQLTRSEEINRSASECFGAILQEACPTTIDAHVAWTKFGEQVLLPAIRALGARTYEILSGQDVVLEGVFSFSDFLKSFPPDSSEKVREAILSFLHPPKSEVKAWILQELHARFCLEALSLTEDTIISLTRKNGQSIPRFVVFLDTNVVFSVLGVHENPSDEAAQMLLGLIQKLREKVDVKPYVLPPTVDEIKRSLSSHISGLRKIRLTPNLAAAIIAQHQLSGLSRRFAHECLRTGHPMQAEEYFGPYLTALIPLLKARSIELYNDNLDALGTDQQVVDDIINQRDFQNRVYPDRAKHYEQLRHDTVLWHYARRKRPPVVESPLQALYWIVTVDYRFLSFDRHKRRGNPGSVPICIHPSSFIQMLQFWVPRSAELEDALVGSLLWPFFYEEFTAAAEKVTLRILEVLSRFDNSSDLPEEAVEATLMDRALRQKISSEHEVEKQIEAVREALIEQCDKFEREARALRQENVALRDQTERQSKSLADWRRKIRQETAAKDHVEQELSRITGHLATISKAQQDQKERLNFFLKWILCTLAGVIFLALGLGVVLNLALEWPLWKAISLGLALFLLVWVWLLDRLAESKPSVSQWKPLCLVHRFRKWMWAVLGLICIGILGSMLGNALWDWLKGIL